MVTSGHGKLGPTCSDYLLNLQVSGIDFTGKFFDSLTGVLVRGWVNVILNSTFMDQTIYVKQAFLVGLFNCTFIDE